MTSSFPSVPRHPRRSPDRRIPPALKVAVGVLIALFVLAQCGDSNTEPLRDTGHQAAPEPTRPTAPRTAAAQPRTTTAKPSPAPTSRKPRPDRYRVTAVVDGDTVKLTRIAGGGQVTVRLLGIDTPETRDPRRGVGCYGPEASAWATRVLLGKRVAIRTDKTQDVRDRYGRLLAYIRLPDGRDYSTAAARGGYAKHYVYGTPVARAAQIEAAERAARSAGRGLWGRRATATPMPLPSSPRSRSNAARADPAGRPTTATATPLARRARPRCTRETPATAATWTATETASPASNRR